MFRSADLFYHEFSTLRTVAYYLAVDMTIEQSMGLTRQISYRYEE